MACIIRVPIEVVKQRQQAGVHKSSLNIIRQILSTEGPIGMYRGYITTVFREIPFAFIQFPLWEMLKKKWSDKNGLPLSPWQSAVCGAVSGNIFLKFSPNDPTNIRLVNNRRYCRCCHDSFRCRQNSNHAG